MWGRDDEEHQRAVAILYVGRPPPGGLEASRCLLDPVSLVALQCRALLGTRAG